MAETTLQLGFVPKERGNYTSGTNYYKDNVVQYNGSSYIADPVGWSESDPTATYVTVPPTDASGNLNAGWRVFASGNNTFTTGEKVENVGIDSEPTAGSDNLVKSGGVYDLIPTTIINRFKNKLIDSSLVSIGDYFNESYLISTAYNIDTFVLNIKKDTTLSLIDWSTASTVYTAILTDTDNKVTQLIDLDASTIKDYDILIANDGYLYIPNVFINASNSGKIAVKSMISSNSAELGEVKKSMLIKTNSISLDSTSQYEKRNYYVPNNTYAIGDSFTESDLVSYSGNVITTLIIPTTKNMLIHFKDWAFGSASKYAILTDSENKIILTKEFPISIKYEFDIIAPTNGHLYISEALTISTDSIVDTYQLPNEAFGKFGDEIPQIREDVEKNKKINISSLTQFLLKGKLLTDTTVSSLEIGDTFNDLLLTDYSSDLLITLKLPVKKDDIINLYQFKVPSACKYLILVSENGLIDYISNPFSYSNFNDSGDISVTNNGYLYLTLDYQSTQNPQLLIRNVVNAILSKLDDSSYQKEFKTLDSTVISKIIRGDAVKIGFLGDSTTDGLGTTGFDRATTGHEGSQWDNIYNGGSGIVGSTDYINEEAYPYKLEQLIKEETGNENFRVYNMGWASTTAKWAYERRKYIFTGAYADVDIVGIVYGINDTISYGNNIDEVIEQYEYYMESLILFLNYLNKGVFIVNPQNVLKYPTQYNPALPTNNLNVINLFKEVNLKLARKYNLTLIDMTSFDVNLLKNKSTPIKDVMYDNYHYNSYGHTLESGFLFSELFKRTVKLAKESKVSFIDYNWKSNADVSLIMPQNIGDVINGFPAYFNSVGNSTDVVLMDVWLLNDSEKALDIVVLTNGVESQYCTIKDGVLNTETVSIDSIEKVVDSIPIGEIRHILVQSGTGKRDVVGIKLQY